MAAKIPFFVLSLALAFYCTITPGMGHANPTQRNPININRNLTNLMRERISPFVYFPSPILAAIKHGTASGGKSPAIVTVIGALPHPLVKNRQSLKPAISLIAAPASSHARQYADSDKKVTLAYTLRFLRGPLPASDGKSDGETVSDTEIDAYGNDKTAADVATFLNGLYPDSTHVTVRENRLILTGPEDQVNNLRQMLALSLDVPSPQVKADVYTIQVNTTPHNRDAAQDKIEEIADGIQIVRDLIHGSEGVLGSYLGKTIAKVEPSPGDLYPALKATLFKKMRLAGYNPSPHRPLNLTDMLILLVPSDRYQFHMQLIPEAPGNNQTNITDALENELFKVRRQVTTRDVSLWSPGYSATDATAYARHGKDLSKLLDRIETKVMIARRDQKPVFRRLDGVYAGPADSDMQGMIEFLDAWHACQGAFLHRNLDARDTADTTSPEYPDEEEFPDWLSNKSAATDLLLKEAMDALTADLQEIYFQPLLDWIREDVRGTHAGDTGIDLVGTTSITVRDRMLVETQGTADSYFKYTPIPHLTMDSLTSAKTLASGTAATPDTTTQRVATDTHGNAVLMANGDPQLLTPDQQLATDASGNVLRRGNSPTGDPVILTVPDTSLTKSPSALAGTVFGAMSPLQQLALQAALNEDAVVPTYRKVTPGTSLALRPFVLADGGSARVQMSLTSTIDSDAPDTTKRDVPFDVIAKHTVTTEATISAFDLEAVSSFGAQTTALGDYAWRIPLLDQVPLLGDLFHGPRSRETKRQDSIAIVNLTIVNLTILPRSLDLVPFYMPSPPQ